MRRERASGDFAVSDVVVVGGGIAGLTCALRLAPRRVTLITRLPVGQGGNTPWAQGGIAAAMAPPDSPRLHAHDTLAAGAGLCDANAVAWLTRDAPRAIQDLVTLGTRLDRAADGSLALGREAAHSHPRIVHAHGDATGAEVMRALAGALKSAPHVHVDDRSRAVDLVCEDGRVTGVTVMGPDGQLQVWLASAVILATGGVGRVYRHTTNPPEATGDGLAMAARAGAVLADLEFVQFHPTALDVEADPRPLLTEALRGKGAWLVDETGRRFVFDTHPDGELAPRDVVSRAIWAHQAAGHRVFLEARTAIGDAFPRSFPTVFETCQRHGIDPRTDLVPVTPAAHYHMGGIAVDAKGRSSLPGLWACGEVACTGVHGANRLASNSLLEGLVFGARVADDIKASRPARLLPGPRRCPPVSAAPGDGVGVRDDGGAVVSAVRDLMWQRVGLVRDASGLRQALAQLEALSARSRHLDERNLVLVGRLVATAALARPESRGGHFRADHPHPDPRWRRRTFVTMREDGRLHVLPAREAGASLPLEGVA